MKDIDRELRDALAAIGSEFRSNELAYLATTTKVEASVRDRFAYQLHRDYEDAGLIVAREWNRIDLAVLDGKGSPISLVELKAMYSFDALRNIRLFTSATSDDEVKAHRRAEGHTAVYSLLLVTHLAGTVPTKFLKPVKYSGGINRALAKHGDESAVLAGASAAIDVDLAGRNVVARGKIDGGCAFGLSVSVHYWLVRNDRPPISN